MRITAQVLHSITDGASPDDVEYLDLAEHSVVAIELLHHFPNLARVDLSGNRLETVENLETCRELWHLDISHNKIRTIEGLRHFPLFGTLALSDNRLDWQALKAVQHIHLVDLHLQGNVALQADIFYRMHVIDCLPRVWMLDGIMVTACERQRVSKFFKDRSSRAGLKPVRRKLPPKKFVPSGMKKLMVNGIFGSRTKQLMSHVPISSPDSTELDWCRLRYIMKMFGSELKMIGEHSSAISYSSVSSASLAADLLPNLDDLFNERHHHLEQSNMLLLLLVVSLEFSLPARLIENALETARLVELGKVHCMQLFLLEKRLRCRLCGILFSAAILDRDSGEREALYPQLYSALRSIVTSLMYKAFCGADGAQAEQHRQHSLPSSEHNIEVHRQLLAAEVVQLFCLVPSFFNLLTTDSGVLELAMVATGEEDLLDDVTTLQEELTWGKVDRWQIYQRLAAYLLLKVKATMDTSTARNPQHGGRQLSQTRKAVFKRATSSPAQRPATVASGHRPKSSPIGKTQTAPSYISKNRAGKIASASTVLSSNQPRPHPRVGDPVLVQEVPKVLGSILSFTDNNSAILQVQRASSVHGAQGSAEHLLIDLEHLVFDRHGYWRPGRGDMIGARQKTWQSADALMAHAGSPVDGFGRFSPAPPPSSPHQSRTTSAADITGDHYSAASPTGGAASGHSSDSDTGTESGDEDGDSISPPKSHAVHATAADGHAFTVARAPPLPRAGNYPAHDDSRRSRLGDELALQAHVEMVIQHLEYTGLSKQTVAPAPRTTKQAIQDELMERSASKLSIAAASVASHSVAAAPMSPQQHRVPQYERHQRLASLPGVPPPTAAAAPPNSAHIGTGGGLGTAAAAAAASATATVRHSLNSTIPTPGYAEPAVDTVHRRGMTTKSAPPSLQEQPQLATRTVTMAFQSRRQTGRAASWNTVRQPVNRSATGQAKTDQASHSLASSLASSLPLSVALEISQNPRTSFATSAIRQEAWRSGAHGKRQQQAIRSAPARRTLGAMPVSGLHPII